MSERESSSFLMKQRPFIKLYLMTMIENGSRYGMELLEEMKKEFQPYGYVPQHSEIYRALHELLEDGLLKRGKVKKPGSTYQEIVVYYIRDVAKVEEFKRMSQIDVKRSYMILKKAMLDHFEVTEKSNLFD